MVDVLALGCFVSFFVSIYTLIKRKDYSKKHKRITYLSSVMFFILFAIFAPPVEETADPAPKPTESKPVESVQPQKTESKEKLLEKAIQERLEKDVSVRYWGGDRSSNLLMVRFAIDDNLFSDSIIRGAQQDMIAILSEYKKVVWNKKIEIAIDGTFPSVDKYGNINNDEIGMSSTVSYKTLMKMNLENMMDMPYLLENAADAYFLYRYMQG